ncbi:MAG: hypothetical protein H0W88_07450 [Parachlamydiaceae bacterium]|nr:hypothetical protein [Parachlamydiaceae bacterium]
MKIQTFLEKTSTYRELEPVFKKAKEDISFFGCRYIFVEGYSGTLHINDLASHVMNLLEKTNYEFDEIDRKPGFFLSKRIGHLYEVNNKRMKDKNTVTRTMCKIRDFVREMYYFFFGKKIYDPSFVWERTNDSFFYYTANQYKNTYGEIPTSEPREHFPTRWMGRFENPDFFND